MRPRFALSAVKRPVTPAAALITIAGLLAFVTWSAYVNLFAPPRPAPLDANGRKAVAFFKAMAKKYGTDISKFTPEERAKFNQITHGAGGPLPLRMALEGKFDF
jgi:hypothetical protein